MRKICSDCKTRFDVQLDDLDDGDPVGCPECGLEYTLIFEGKTPRLVESKKLELGDDDEEDFDSDDDY